MKSSIAAISRTMRRAIRILLLGIAALLTLLGSAQAGIDVASFQNNTFVK